MGEKTDPIVDAPNVHNMFILGKKTLYLSHMPMFHKEDHRYQVTLQARLDAKSMAVYLADKAAHPREVYNLVNPDDHTFILPDVANGTITSFPAIVYRSYSNQGGPANPIVPNATVTVERVIRYRALNQDIPRPGHLTYILFGDGEEAHLDHYIAQDPDFQHLLTLPEVPAWLPTSQLRAGVEVSFIGMKSAPIGCHNPLTASAYQVMFEGLSFTRESLSVGASATVWYSTGNMLNAQDPCPAPGGAHKPAD